MCNARRSFQPQREARPGDRWHQRNRDDDCAGGLLQAGARVVINSRNADACARAQDRLSEFGDVWAVPADLSRHEECDRLAELVTDDSGCLDILVNNAGAIWDEPLETFPDTAWDTVIDLNLKSPVLAGAGAAAGTSGRWDRR